MVVYRQAAKYVQWVLTDGSWFLFLSILEGGEKEELVLTPAQMTTNLSIHLRAAGMEYRRYAMHSFQVGEAASHNVEGTAMNVLVEYVGWKPATVARRYVGATASVAAAGGKLSRKTAFESSHGRGAAKNF